jgi:dephospho-CoA kinase
MITLVTGFAGAGKTTFIRSVQQAYKFVYIHDEWVDEQYNSPCVRAEVQMLFGGSFPQENFKEAVKLKLREQPELNPILANYFKAKYCMLMASLSPWDSPSIMETPFLSDNLEALKKAHPGKINVVWINTPDDLEDRLKARGWNDERIDLSLEMQRKDFKKYKHLIDDYV